jgi:hypothetical protein
MNLPKLEDISLGNRIAITVILVLVILLALALFGWWSGSWEDDEARGYGFGLASAATRPELCMDADTRERVRKLMIEALDESLKSKIEDLFAVWLRDATDQPRRAQTGMNTALRAFIGARDAAMKFNPPECSG